MGRCPGPASREALVALCALTHGPSFQPSAHEGVSDGVLYVNCNTNSSLTSVALGRLFILYKKAPRLARLQAPPSMSITIELLEKPRA